MAEETSITTRAGPVVPAPCPQADPEAEGETGIIRPLSSFTPVEQRAILALIRCADSPYVAPPADHGRRGDPVFAGPGVAPATRRQP